MSPAYPRIYNPRASAGSLSLPPQRRPYVGGPPSPSDSTWSSRSYDDSTLPLNTPYSSSPTASGSTASRRHRRSSVVEQPRPILSNKGAAPIVVQKQIRAASPTRNERHGHSSRVMVVPGSPHNRRNRSATSYSTHTGRYYEAHRKSVAQDQRRGRTRFPKKVVSREAAEEKKYPYTIDEDGAVTVLQALGQPEIEALVALTEEIRRRSVPSRKAVSFYEKTIVHEVPPSAPSPPPSEATIAPPPRSGTPFNPELLSPHGSSSKPSSRYSQPVILVPGTGSGGRRTSRYVPVSPAYFSSSPSTIEPLLPPGPSTPKPTSKNMELRLEAAPSHRASSKTPEEKIVKAEEKAVKAARIAEKKELRAHTTGRAVDAEDAWKARTRADELKKKLVELERKESLKYVKGDVKRRPEKEKRVRVGRNHKGEIIMIKG